jgi:hypothetical protein
MTQSLTETLTEAAQAAAKAEHLERDRETWNLPRARGETASRATHRNGLDWNGFRDLYYPDSRRHDLAAIVAYGAYREALLAAQPGERTSSSAVMRLRSSLATTG